MEPKEQRAGDVYIACPAFIDHAVEFPDMPHDWPTLSIQARTLIPSRAHLVDFSTHDFKTLRAYMCRVLKEGKYVFVLPSHEEVQAVADKLDEDAASAVSPMAKRA